MLRLLCLLLLFSSCVCLSAQGHFKVELESFSPSDQQVIEIHKDKSAQQFLAKDISGEEVSLSSASDKIRLLWFWSIEDASSTQLLPYLNLLQLDELDDVWIYGFASEEKDAVSEIAFDQAIIFSIIPNASMLGEMAYGGDLGDNRLFITDEAGIIKEIFPRSFFLDRSPEEAIEVIRQVITSLKIH